MQEAVHYSVVRPVSPGEEPGQGHTVRKEVKGRAGREERTGPLPADAWQAKGETRADLDSPDLEQECRRTGEKPEVSP